MVLREVGFRLPNRREHTTRITPASASTSKPKIAFCSSAESLLVAVDIKKGYNSLPHEGIFNSMDEQEITGKTLTFVKGFLNERCYAIDIGQYLSSVKINNIDVSQVRCCRTPHLISPGFRCYGNSTKSQACHLQYMQTTKPYKQTEDTARICE